MQERRTDEHVPVLLEEAVAALAIRSDGFYVDATFGRGGHSRAILARLSNEGAVLAIDRDPEAVAVAGREFAADPRFTIAHGTFDRLAEFTGGRAVDGVLFDFGVSSPQLDDASRGFSFLRDGPLDMRMDPGSGESAARWLARVPEREMAQVIAEYGEERFARRIARAIVAARAAAPIETTAQLAAIVATAVPKREPGKNPATRTFQALRIQTNDELGSIDRGLAQALDALRVGGRLVAISFHSLEDRRVKRFMRTAASGDPLWRGLPNAPDWAQPRLDIVGGAVEPGTAEVAVNPRSRSARLRVAVKVRA